MTLKLRFPNTYKLRICSSMLNKSTALLQMNFILCFKKAYYTLL